MDFSADTSIPHSHILLLFSFVKYCSRGKVLTHLAIEKGPKKASSVIYWIGNKEAVIHSESHYLYLLWWEMLKAAAELSQAFYKLAACFVILP